jgi:hypothetical protein
MQLQMHGLQSCTASLTTLSTLIACGRLGEAWGKVVPAEIGGQCELRHIKRGVLTVCAPNASVKFKLDAWLRAGGEQTVGQAARSVTKVRVL